jgi:hypothetical protein
VLGNQKKIVAFPFFFRRFRQTWHQAHSTSSKDFYPFLCLHKNVFEARFIERCRNRLSDVINFLLQNKYTFLSQPTLSFIELENLFKMFSFVPRFPRPLAVAKKTLT